MLYAIELDSNFSRCILKKQFDNFLQLQTDLLRLQNQVVLQPQGMSNNKLVVSKRLHDVLPRLPSSLSSLIWRSSVPSNVAEIEQRKESLTKYSQVLLELIESTL